MATVVSAKPVVVLILLSGKRCAGKDYFAEVFEEWLTNKFKQGLLTEFDLLRIAFADGCKEGFAKFAGLDYERLMNDRLYKESHRVSMTSWYKQTVSDQPDYFQDVVAKKVSSASKAAHSAGRSRVIMCTDCRRHGDMSLFAETAEKYHKSCPSLCLDGVLTIRITASAAARARRGWVFQKVKDEDATECELDHYPFACELDNSGDDGAAAVNQWLDRMVLPGLQDVRGRLPRVLFPSCTPTATDAGMRQLIEQCRIYPGFNVNKGARRILFNDVLGVFADPACTKIMVDAMSRVLITDAKPPVTALLGISSRGYPYASMLAYKHGLKLVFARSGGKTPGPIAATNVAQKNYGSGDLEVSMLTLGKSDVVVVLDDLLATGGSLLAAANAAIYCGARVSTLFAFAEFKSDFGGRCVGGGRGKLEKAGFQVVSLMSYEPGDRGAYNARLR